MSESVVRRTTVRVTNPNGLHLVPCSLVVKTAMRFESEIRVHKGANVVDAKTVIDLMTLGATQGTELELVAEGPDAVEAIEKLVALFATEFVVDESAGPAK